ncbi:MAG TPA: hypothetical protein VH413_18170 [Verrucomicrobiae bacterium]|jgi:hypothetical protein|nr:hypothetical protein [Verrucomicrobiae bacterium]
MATIPANEPTSAPITTTKSEPTLTTTAAHQSTLPFPSDPAPVTPITTGKSRV